MNPQFRNVAIAAASLGLLVSLFFALRSSADEETSSRPTHTTTSAAPTQPSETATTATTTPVPSDVATIRLLVREDSAGEIRRLSVEQGRAVELVVTSELADEVHVHGYDLMADVAPGSPATIRFTADTPGLFEIELEELGVQIAELEVRP